MGQLIITEEEKNRILFLHEQVGALAGGVIAGRFLEKFYKKYPHEINLVLSTAAVFIPYIGPALSAGINLWDAKIYYDEKDYKTAGLVTMFAAIPVIGSISSKIPGVKKLGVKGMTNLAKKFASKSNNLTKLENEVLDGILKNSEMVAKETKSYSERLKKFLKKSPKRVVKTIAPYAAAGYAYNKGYDWLNPSQNNLQDLNSIDVSKISQVNKDAAENIQW